jgi:hypothetical protein
VKLTLPSKSRRKKQPYLAIRSKLTARQAETQARLFFPELRAFFEARAIRDLGPAFIRYNMVNDKHEMDMEFGFFTTRLHTGSGPVRAGIMPGGTFYTVIFTGHHRRVPDAERMLLGWGKMSGIDWDSATTEGGDFFGCRLDIFRRHEGNEPDSDNWETEIAVMIRGTREDR